MARAPKDIDYAAATYGSVVPSFELSMKEIMRCLKDTIRKDYIVQFDGLHMGNPIIRYLGDVIRNRDTFNDLPAWIAHVLFLRDPDALNKSPGGITVDCLHQSGKLIKLPPTQRREQVDIILKKCHLNFHPDRTSDEVDKRIRTVIWNACSLAVQTLKANLLEFVAWYGWYYRTPFQAEAAWAVLQSRLGGKAAEFEEQARNLSNLRDDLNYKLENAERERTAGAQEIAKLRQQLQEARAAAATGEEQAQLERAKADLEAARAERSAALKQARDLVLNAKAEAERKRVDAVTEVQQLREQAEAEELRVKNAKSELLVTEQRQAERTTQLQQLREQQQQAKAQLDGLQRQIDESKSALLVNAPQVLDAVAQSAQVLVGLRSLKESLEATMLAEVNQRKAALEDEVAKLVTDRDEIQGSIMARLKSLSSKYKVADRDDDAEQLAGRKRDRADGGKAVVEDDGPAAKQPRMGEVGKKRDRADGGMAVVEDDGPAAKQPHVVEVGKKRDRVDDGMTVAEGDGPAAKQPPVVEVKREEDLCEEEDLLEAIKHAWNQGHTATKIANIVRRSRTIVDRRIKKLLQAGAISRRDESAAAGEAAGREGCDGN